MAYINRDLSKILIGNGTTWGTAADLTAANKGKLINGRLTYGAAGFGQFESDDIGFGNFLTEVKNLDLTVDVTFTCNLSHSNVWPQIAANVLGTDTAAPAEVNVGQGDYLHNLDLASSNDGKFQTLAYLIEDDYALELPSVKWHSFTMQSDVNRVGNFTAQGIVRSIELQAVATNNAADIIAGAYQGNYEGAPLGTFTGTNHYFRLNAQAGGALSSSNDLQIKYYTLSVTRPVDRGFYLQGGNSPYTNEPRQGEKTDVRFGIRFWKIDDAVRDWIADWKAGTELKGELFFDGSQIGTGANHSVKIQLPRLRPDENIPPGYDLPDKSFAEPEPGYRCMKATAAPTGMTGVTNCLRMAVVTNRSVRYLN